MNKVLAFTGLLFTIGCASDSQQESPVTELIPAMAISDGQLLEEQFDIQVALDENEGQASLSVALKIDAGSFVVSPHATDSVYGHFTISIVENEALSFSGEVIETPNSVKEFDPVLEDSVKFIRVNTDFSQAINSNIEGDFDVPGMIEFVLEPKCVPYDVEFVITQVDGKLSVVKTKTVISSEYKM